MTFSVYRHFCLKLVVNKMALTKVKAESYAFPEMCRLNITLVYALVYNSLLFFKLGF